MNFFQILEYQIWLFFNGLDFYQVVINILSIFGGLWGIIEMLSYFGKPEVSEFLKSIWWVFLIIGILLVIYKNWPKSYYKFDIKQRDVSISFQIGDIFKTSGSKIIPINYKLDVYNNGIVGKSKSILRFLIDKLYNKEYQHLQTDISNAIQDRSEWYEPFKDGQDTFKIGTVVPIFKNEEFYYFVCSSTLNAQNRSKTTEEDFRTTLNELWTYLQLNGNKDKLIIPLIGTGRGRINLKRIEVLKETVLSFLTSLSSGTFLEELCIVIHPFDIKKYNMDIKEIEDFIKLHCNNTNYVNRATSPVGNPID